MPTTRDLLVSKSGKVAITNVNQEGISSLVLPVPPIAEQKAIAHTLQTIQQAKEARQRELTLERERKAALMQHLFTYGTCGERQKLTEIGAIPESWQVTKLAEICSDKRGLIQTGPFGSQLHAHDYQSTGIPVVNPVNLGFNRIVMKGIPYINTEKADHLSKHYLIEGDILVSRRGNFSRYSYINSTYSGWLCGTGCLLIRVNNNRVNNYFLSILLSTKLCQDYLKQNAVGSIMPNLNTRILQSLPLLLPEIDEQNEISTVLQLCDHKITALESEIFILKEIFHTTLNELMSGKKNLH